jgi:hypothetical protein
LEGLKKVFRGKFVDELELAFAQKRLRFAGQIHEMKQRNPSWDAHASPNSSPSINSFENFAASVD